MCGGGGPGSERKNLSLGFIKFCPVAGRPCFEFALEIKLVHWSSPSYTLHDQNFGYFIFVFIFLYFCEFRSIVASTTVLNSHMNDCLFHSFVWQFIFVFLYDVMVCCTVPTVPRQVGWVWFSSKDLLNTLHSWCWCFHAHVKAALQNGS